MGMDYIEVILDRSRRLKLNMRALGEAELFLSHEFTKIVA